MKKLKTLVKYHKTLLDDRRRELKALLDERDEILAMIDFLLAELEQQRDMIARQVELSFTFGEYERSNNERRAALHERLDDMAQRITVAEEQVREAYSELKKYEITLDLRLEEEIHELERRLQAIADEVSVNRWQRHKKP